jgi:hypothetical protein
MDQSFAQPIFVNIYSLLFSLKKRGPNVLATLIILKELPKVNNCPTVENSANLVTLPGSPVDALNSSFLSWFLSQLFGTRNMFSFAKRRHHFEYKNALFKKFLKLWML